MATASDFVKAALRRISSYQSGETVAAPDMQDCLDTFNDMLDSWSTAADHVPGVVENIVNWVAGKNAYTIGNPTCTELGEPPFQAGVTAGFNVLVPATIPADLVAGATLTSLQNLFPPDTIATAVDPIGFSITMNNNAIAASNGNDSITYTVPGDFAFPRPLMITSGFTRFNNLDFTLDVFETETEYNGILYKAQPGPWPVVAWYNNTYPYGVLKVYQTPANGSELHLFSRTILSGLQANSVIKLPQGYARAVKWCLAKELWVEYWGVVSLPATLNQLAKEALTMIKELNNVPVRSKYDSSLVRGGNSGNQQWIFTGGYQ
jgi:hypothetical protein